MIPSMDDKQTPSPPSRTVDEYEADRILGIVTRSASVPFYGEKRPAPKPTAKQDDYHATLPLRDVIQAGIHARIDRYRKAWEEARAERDAALAEAVRTKTHLPDGYWQKEHRTRALYASAMIMLEVLS